MKTLIKKIMLFILPFALLVPNAEKCLCQEMNNIIEKRAFLESQLGEIEILSTGSSHGNAINPLFFSHKGFTLNNPAQDLYYDSQLVKMYLERLPKLKLIIVPISYFSFGYQLDRSEARSLGAYYHKFWGIPPQHADDYLDLRYYSNLALYGWKGFLDSLRGIFRDPNRTEMDASGFRHTGMQEVHESAEEWEGGKHSVQMQDTGMRPRAIPENLAVLRHLIQTCQSKGVEVVLITTPTYHTYYDYLDEERVRQWQGLVQSVVTEFNLKYLNYLMDERFSSSDFFSRDHLNPHGVEKFSKIIDEEIVQKFFQNTSENP